MKLLLIEDSESLRHSIAYGLGQLKFAVDCVGDGREGLVYALSQDYDVIILDLMLPHMSGLSFLVELRREKRDMHVLVLSALDQVQDRIEALNLGADDYLVKPFDFDELVARINSLVRRRYGTKDPVVVVGSLLLNTALHTVMVGDAEVLLTPKQLAILEFLATHRGRVVSACELETRVYDSDTVSTRNALEAHISGLRRKLKQAGAPPDIVRTRRGLGYCIE